MHPYVELARKTVEEYAKNKKLPKSPPEIPLEMQRRAGVFVSIKKKGTLRGCIGTFMPSAPNLYEEIVKNAFSAANQDPRFSPIREDELKELDYSVDVLSEPEKVNNIS
ncbi:MAG: AmmeMemoRadiSam system protein A, partial [Thermodesulfovibrionales bacterium]|nr:AmmeMemoRadiSam system protein A [Thermodesulfovibrionales bacterium]